LKYNALYFGTNLPAFRQNILYTIKSLVYLSTTNIYLEYIGYMFRPVNRSSSGHQSKKSKVLLRYWDPNIYNYIKKEHCMSRYKKGGSLFLHSTREMSTRLHGITAQKTAPFLITAVRSSDLGYLRSLHGGANCCNEDN